MSLTRRIAHNTIYQVLGKIISTILGVAAVAMMTRYLGKEGYGHYTTVMAFLQFFGILVDLGLSMTTIQMISKPGARQNKIVSNILTFRFITAFVFLSLAPLLVLFFPYPNIVKQGVAVAALSFLVISLNQILTAVFQKEMRMFKVSLAEIIGRGGLVLATGLVIYFQKNLLWILAAVVCGSFLHFLFVYLFSRRIVRIKPSFDFQVWKEALLITWPISISIAFNLLYLKTDTIVLSLVRPAEQVGLYGASYRVIDILVMIPYMFLGLIMPLLTRSWYEKNMDRFRKVLQRSFDFLVMLALPLVVGTQFLATDIMVLIAGSDFAFSGQILRVLVLAAGAIYVASLFGYTIVSIDFQKKMIWAYMAGAVLALTGYFLFIPRYGVWGAAIMTVFVEVFIMVLVIIAIKKQTGITVNLTVFFKAAQSCLLMAALLFWLRDQSLLLNLAAAPLVYFTALYLLGGISKQQVKDILNTKA